MERIGVRELRQHASRYLAMVKSGETVEVTERGELVALLTPPAPAQGGRNRLIAAGRLTPGASAGGRTRLPVPVVICSGELTNEELLDHERAERL